MAFILAKRNIILPSQAVGVPAVALKKDVLADVPDWAADTAYFKALVADGKIVVTDRSDKATQAAAEKTVRKKKTADWDKPAAEQEA